MRKLRLEDIKVDSYETSAVPGESGTVQGNVAATLSCGGTCIRSCQATLCPASCESAPWCC